MLGKKPGLTTTGRSKVFMPSVTKRALCPNASESQENGIGGMERGPPASRSIPHGYQPVQLVDLARCTGAGLQPVAADAQLSISVAFHIKA